MGGLDAALKQSEMKAKELQDLQSVHYSMAEELRNTKDKLHDITAERDSQREELKVANRYFDYLFFKHRKKCVLWLNTCDKVDRSTIVSTLRKPDLAWIFFFLSDGSS